MSASGLAGGAGGPTGPSSLSAMQAEEAELLQDTKYKSYIGQVDKALKCFETTSEWQDLISSLSKLNKLLQTNTKYPVIPKRIIIGKRLAQCMHPVLPFGVHLKALETYDIIFRCIGRERLAHDLFIYSAGLFPLLGHAAMNVKPLLLKLYEDHFIPLGEKLRPGLNGFLVGVLPGMEEGGEFFDRVNVLLVNVAKGVGMQYFYGCLWKCVLCNPAIRLPAVTFVVSKFDRNLSMEEQMEFLGTDRDCMVEAVCSSLQDTSILVQRNTLDFILGGFPLDKCVLEQKDRIRLCTSSLVVLLRRDMGLNRRLYQWIFGLQAMSTHTDLNDNQKATMDYFKQHSAPIVLEALRNLFSYSPAAFSLGFPMTFSVLSPYRVLTALMDRNEISAFILDDILIDVFRSLYLECHTARKLREDHDLRKSKGHHRKVAKHTSEVDIIKAANLFFCNLEQKYLWGYLAKEFKMACDHCHMPDQKSPVGAVGSGRPLLLEVCRLLEFLLEVATLDSYKEAPCEYLPTLLHDVSQALVVSCERLSMPQLLAALKLCSRILQKVQPPDLILEEGLAESPPQSPTPTPQNPNPVTASGVAGHRPTHSRNASNCSIETIKSAKSLTQEEIERSTTLPSMISSCIETFQQLFLKFVELKVLANPQEVANLFHGALCQRQLDSRDREMDLSRLLEKCLQQDEVYQIPVGNVVGSSATEFPGIVLKLRQQWGEETFETLCSLIVELSSFPVSLGSNSKQVLECKGSICDGFPKWLSHMLMLSCFAEDADCLLWTLSMILELINLSRTTVLSLMSEARGKGVHSMVILPMIHPLELRFIVEETRFMQVATNRLWEMLRDEDARYHLHVAELLQKLHNLAPNDGVCENVLCRGLSSDSAEKQIEAQKRFAVLWHLLRDIKQKPQATLRYFDRCLFQMLDCLTKDSGPHRAISQFWLEHSLSRGDLNRILEPVLIVLLHPDTSRVSINHVSVRKHRITVDQKSQQEREEDVDRKIYAISQVAGNIIYHHSMNEEKAKGKNRGVISPTDRPMLALTSLDTRSIASGKPVGKYVTGMSAVQDLEFPLGLENPQQPMSVFVNPMGSSLSLMHDFLDPDSLNSSTSLMPDLSVATRMDHGSLRKASYDEIQSISNVSTARIEDAQSECSRNLETASLPGNIGTISSTTGAGTAEVVNSIMDDLLDEAVKSGTDTVSVGSETPNLRRIFRDGATSEAHTPTSDHGVTLESFKQPNADSPVHPLHQHMLLYSQVYDAEKALYALQSIKNIVDASRREALWQMATTHVYHGGTLKRDPPVDVLLARHRKAIDGDSFQGDMSSEQLNYFRSFKYLDVLVYLCLQYLRSYYPHVPQQGPMTARDVVGNCNVRLLTCDVLQAIFQMLEERMHTRKELPGLVLELLNRCKVQKTLLHCLVASVFQQRTEKENADVFTFHVIDFNDKKTVEFQFTDTFQVHLLKLMCSLIQLEDRVIKPQSGGEISDNKAGSFGKIKFKPQISTLKYVNNVPIPSQTMFTTAALIALKQQHKLHLQSHWMELTMTSLPYSVRNSSQSVSRFIIQIANELCLNLETIVSSVQAAASKMAAPAANCPPDYIVTSVGNLRTLLHYCLLDETSPSSAKQQPLAQNPTGAPLLSSLFHAFASDTQQKDGAHKDAAANPVMVTIRRTLLLELQRYLSSLLTVWQAMAQAERAERGSGDHRPNQLLVVMGAPRLVKQQVIQCLQAISEHYGDSFLAAVGAVWHERARKSGKHGNVVPPIWTTEQLLLVELVYQLSQQKSDLYSSTGSIPPVGQDPKTVFSLTRIVYFVKKIFKDPPNSLDKKKLQNLEVSVLQFLLAYLQHYPHPENLGSACQSLMGLWKEGLQHLNNVPPVQFHLLAILHEYVQKAPLIEDRKDQKDLQEIAQKLIESISTIASASLEQTTWLRRTLAVKSGVQQDITEHEDTDQIDAMKIKQQSAETSANLSAYSVQALFVLAEFLAPVLDIVYVSEDKDKVVPLLTNIMVYVTPFLRNHSKNNGPSFRACSQLLASFSGYQYTRKAWRKDAFDLLCESSFFQMDHACLHHWRSIIDHLMTHDKTTYRDFMSRVTSVPQSGSLNIFGSNEKEYEQRAQLLKRLAYVIFCSEPDQYQKYMPEISERLAENLKLSQVPIIQSAVFLCFRVILLRMSPSHVTSMWPGIITELVHACLMMEQELLDSEGQKIAKAVASSHLQSLDYNLQATSASHTTPAYLSLLTLYLSACKLLDMAIAMPADLLPQFQVYRWAFIGDGAPSVDGNEGEGFVPHMKRLATLLNQRFPGNRTRLHYVPGRPLMDATSIKSLADLQPFFNTLIESNKPKVMPGESHPLLVQQPSLSRRLSHGIQHQTSKKEAPKEQLEQKTALDYIENIIECDFLELRTS
ncbi:protein dopey-1-like isoform X3 [Varroa jacobsoni]|nr:protein dopey-1-like isoform X4 [Varroa destructor]XP_022650870.1 protein dopey-1-like isoform X4 [Varroa destructor]XP_022704944.1 protein dopey-1-like isoform X3 [Varroa jacobsoni]XP_022704945.1 protein dopey-1-like isoform X3 [Varroa jacobsoni]